MKETVAFIGCSRGLGHAVCMEWSRRELGDQSLLVSRNIGLLETLSKQLHHPSELLSLDFAKDSAVDELIPVLKELKPSRLFYFAGGGPFGLFPDKEWKDHQWALNVTLLSPMKLIHRLLRDDELRFLKQVICVGSLIADQKPDPMAASYATAKHGLYGLLSTLVAEESPLDVRLFRPGYMDTDLLPPNAKPRRHSQPVASPETVAESFVGWALDPQGSPLFDA